jgi:error-prone DNA polymerase
VEVRPIDVNHSEWDCTLEDPTPIKGNRLKGKRGWGQDGPAVRLGFRLIKGMQITHAGQIVAARKIGRFQSIEHFHRKTSLSRSTVERLADADAFGSLKQSRRQSLWHTLALPEQRLPLADRMEIQESEQIARLLPPMPLREEVLFDYSVTGLSLKKHPIALVRDELRHQGIITAAELTKIKAGKRVKVAGLVLVRQRPGTASGVVFATIEDETGTVNLIIWPKVFDRFRVAARHASLLQAEGLVQREEQVIHVVAWRLFDLSGLIHGMESHSRDFH